MNQMEGYKKSICITGGIGSGKSVVSRILRLKQYPVYDCDSRAKALMETSPEIIRELNVVLDGNAFLSNGRLNRELIAERIFTDKILREGVNAIVHHAVREDFKTYLKLSSSPLVFIETAIPVTAHIADVCDAIWHIDAEEDLRLKRAISRDKSDELKIRRRMQSQVSEFAVLPDGKTSRLINDGVTSLLHQIDRLLLTEICDERV